MPALPKFRRDKASPLWTRHAGFNEFLARFTEALCQPEPSALLACLLPGSDIWCLARVFGPACLRSLLGMNDGSTSLRESIWMEGERESLLIWSLSNGGHATLMIENREQGSWHIHEILPFDPRAGEPDAGSREAYRQFLNQPPRQARTGNGDWDQTLQAILQDPPLKPSMPLAGFISQILPLSHHLSEILDFFEQLDELGWKIDPWISIRDCTYVFRAKHSQSAELAAVKWLSDDKANYLAKFRHEIELLRDLKNLAGTPIYLDHGESAGRPYHLCRWEIGHNLEFEPDYFQALSTERKLRIAANTLRAVVRVHEAGILHRDIAPDHLLVGQNDDVILLDFGMSSRIDQLEEGDFKWFMENELSNLGFTLHTLLVGGISFPFGDTEALKAVWTDAAKSLENASLEAGWKRLIAACIGANPRIDPSQESKITPGFTLIQFLKFHDTSHFQIDI